MFNWHVPFYLLALLSVFILVASWYVMPALEGHLHHARDQHPATRMLAVLSHPDHQMAFIFMAVLTCTGFLVFPYISNYMVANAGLTEKQLPLIYLSGGLCTLFSMNWIGRWADRSGKLRVFKLMSFSALVPILTVTNLPRVPVVFAIATSTLLMICMSGRRGAYHGPDDREYRRPVSRRVHEHQFLRATILLWNCLICRRSYHGPIRHRRDHPFPGDRIDFCHLRSVVDLSIAFSEKNRIQCTRRNGAGSGGLGTTVNGCLP